MNAGEKMISITKVEAPESGILRLTWSDGSVATVDVRPLMRSGLLRAAVQEFSMFRRVAVGDWGHSIEWPNGADLGADRLWLETLSALGRIDTRAFLEWRMKHGLSLNAAAEALGVSRRSIANWSSGEHRIAKTVRMAIVLDDLQRSSAGLRKRMIARPAFDGLVLGRGEGPKKVSAASTRIRRTG